jgi:hypothetical protein
LFSSIIPPLDHNRGPTHKRRVLDFLIQTPPCQPIETAAGQIPHNIVSQRKSKIAA